MSIAAGRMRKAGIIGYHRGHIQITDQPALELVSCECFAVMQDEYRRLLPLFN